MDFAFTSDQQALRESVRDFLQAECTSSRVRTFFESEDGTDPALWEKVVGLGWPGLTLPEKFGGIGLGWVEASLLGEEMGRFLFPSPYMSTLLVATAIQLGGTDEQKERFLPKFAAGSLTGALALFEGRSMHPEDIRIKARPSEGNVVLDGKKLFVADGHVANLLLVAVQGDEGPGFVIVESSAPGVKIEPLPVVDMTRRQSAISFSEVEVPRSLQLPGRAYLFDRIRDRMLLFLAAENSGIARRVFEMSVEYAKTRQQFGKPIGIFQGVSHKLADMYMSVEHATSLVYYAAWVADQADQADLASQSQHEAGVAAWRASLWCAGAARRASADGIQIHGGIGFTWEHDLHMYFKRARANQFICSEPSIVTDLLAQTLG